jgi:nitroreductase
MNSTQIRYAAPQLRASDADRDAVLALLSEHFQAGRLTAEEFDERSGQALTARTYGELAALTADLPAPATAPAPGPAPARPARRGALLVLAMVAVALIACAALGVAAGWRHGDGLWWVIPVGLLAARRVGLGGGPGGGRIRRY